MTEEGAIKKFQELGYSYEDRETAGTGVDSLGSKTFHKDSDLPNVLVFPSGTDFTTTDLYQEGAIFLQDKVIHTHRVYSRVCIIIKRPIHELLSNRTVTISIISDCCIREN